MEDYKSAGLGERPWCRRHPSSVAKCFAKYENFPAVIFYCLHVVLVCCVGNIKFWEFHIFLVSEFIRVCVRVVLGRSLCFSGCHPCMLWLWYMFTTRPVTWFHSHTLTSTNTWLSTHLPTPTSGSNNTWLHSNTAPLGISWRQTILQTSLCSLKSAITYTIFYTHLLPCTPDDPLMCLFTDLLSPTPASMHICILQYTYAFASSTLPSNQTPASVHTPASHDTPAVWEGEAKCQDLSTGWVVTDTVNKMNM